MEPSENPESDMCICVRCGHSNECGASRCEGCKAPLDDFAASVPWEMGSASGSAYARVDNWRVKPIVFWGVWLYFGPSAIGSLCIIAYMTYYIFNDQGHFNDEYIGDSVSMLMTLAYGALSGWAVYAVSKNYFRKDLRQSEDDAGDS